MACSLADDPDWGHKPSDDDFTIDALSFSDNIASTKISLVLDTLTKANAFTKGETYLQDKDYDTARAVFKVGADEFHCPLCSTRYGNMLAEGIGRHCMLSKLGEHWTATLTEALPYDSAIYYLQKGLEAKVPLAAFSMALYYIQGRGEFPEDKELAIKHMKIAANWGYKPAIEAMNEYRKQNKRPWLSILGRATSEVATDSIGESIGERIAKGLSHLF